MIIGRLFTAAALGIALAAMVLIFGGSYWLSFLAYALGGALALLILSIRVKAPRSPAIVM